MSKQFRKKLINRLIYYLYQPRSKANHLLRARRANGQGIHSPYLYRFVTTVLNTKWPYYAFEALEAAHSTTSSKVVLPFRKKEPHRIQRLLFRIVQDQQPETMLEVGNRDGIDTQYLVNACPKAHCRSITFAPGSKEDQRLKQVLSETEKLDFVLFQVSTDRKQRLDEFKMCLQKRKEDAIFAVKHIHQNSEQAFVWKLMRNHPDVRASIDLHILGILFFRNDLPKCKLRIKM